MDSGLHEAVSRDWERGLDTWPWELPIPTALVLGQLYASVWDLGRRGREERKV
jgi:hypothetical protein